MIRLGLADAGTGVYGRNQSRVVVNLAGEVGLQFG